MLKVYGSALKYVNASLVLCRGDNDSFLDKGIANRFRMDFEGYQLLGEYLFLDEEIRSAFKAVMRREHKWYSLSRLKSEVDDDRKWKAVKNSLFIWGYGSSQLFLIDTLGSSKSLVSLLRS